MGHAQSTILGMGCSLGDLLLICDDGRRRKAGSKKGATSNVPECQGRAGKPSPLPRRDTPARLQSLHMSLHALLKSLAVV